MDERAHMSSPLEAALAKLKRSEESPWGKAQNLSHRWLARLEGSALLQRYPKLRKKTGGIPSLRADPAVDLDSLFVVSLLVHLLLLFLLAQIASRSAPSIKPEPIVVRLLELPRPAQERIQEPKKRAEKKTLPPQKPVEQKPAAPPKAPDPQPVNPAPKPAPSLPAPKVLAQTPLSNREASFSGQPAQSLVQLPTRSPGTEPTSVATAIEPLPAPLAGAKGLPSEPSTEGAQAAFSRPDFRAYLQTIKKRVEASWKYPEGISGKQLINILFVIDKGGKLMRAEVLDSSDPRLKDSAIAAIKRASPFPPIPANLAKELAGWPLRLQFSIDFGVKLSQ